MSDINKSIAINHKLFENLLSIPAYHSRSLQNYKKLFMKTCSVSVVHNIFSTATSLVIVFGSSSPEFELIGRNTSPFEMLQSQC